LDEGSWTRPESKSLGTKIKKNSNGYILWGSPVHQKEEAKVGGKRVLVVVVRGTGGGEKGEGGSKGKVNSRLKGREVAGSRILLNT